jgi:hypothetical protein
MWLVHIDFLLKIFIHKDILYIHVTYFPLPLSS